MYGVKILNKIEIGKFITLPLREDMCVTNNLEVSRPSRRRRHNHHRERTRDIWCESDDVEDTQEIQMEMILI